MKHTSGNWKPGKGYGAVVSDTTVEEQDEETTTAYGGYLICESVSSYNRPIIATAPELLEVARALIGDGPEYSDESGRHCKLSTQEVVEMARKALAKFRRLQDESN